MILDIPYRSRVYNLTAHDSQLLAHLEDHTSVKDGLRHTVLIPWDAAGKGGGFLNALDQIQPQPFFFTTKLKAMEAIRRYYSL
jgi:hypothetical protein